jgi:hypothetical protein
VGLTSGRLFILLVDSAAAYSTLPVSMS